MSDNVLDTQPNTDCTTQIAWEIEAGGGIFNGEVRGEGKRSLPESSAEGATSTVVLGAATNQERN